MTKDIVPRDQQVATTEEARTPEATPLYDLAFEISPARGVVIRFCANQFLDRAGILAALLADPTLQRWARETYPTLSVYVENLRVVHINNPFASIYEYEVTAPLRWRKE